MAIPSGYDVTGGLPTSGTLTAAGDPVSMAAPGNQLATVRFLVNNAGTATATAQISNNGGTEWLPAAYAKRIDVTSGVGGNGTAGNPAVQAITATTLVTGQSWEIPIPGNCTNFRLLCGGTGTATNVTVQGSALYSPGSPVVAVLYSVLAPAVGVSPVFDLAGWTSFYGIITNSATSNIAFQQVARDGTPISNMRLYTAANAGVQVGSSKAASLANTLSAASSQTQGWDMLPWMDRFLLNITVATSGRIELVVSR